MEYLSLPCFDFARAGYEDARQGVLSTSMPSIHLGQMGISFRMNEIQQILLLTSWHL